MPTNKQKRDAARRHLERQLKRRAEREAARRRFAIIGSVLGTVVLVAAVVVAVVLIGHKDKKSTAASSPTTGATSATPSASSASPTPSTSYPKATGGTVSFDDVTVTGATDLKGYPTVTSQGTTDPKKLAFKDLVVGKGTAPTASQTVTVQYVGVLYKKGTKPFDSSWARGQAASFSLAQVVKGFTYGIAGTTGVPPMKVGGRRLIIMPSALGYGAQSPSTDIPANSPLVFVIDLTKVG